MVFGWNLKNMAWGHVLDEGIKRNIQQQSNHCVRLGPHGRKAGHDHKIWNYIIVQPRNAGGEKGRRSCSDIFLRFQRLVLQPSFSLTELWGCNIKYTALLWSLLSEAEGETLEILS